MTHLIVEVLSNLFFIALDTAMALIGRRRPVYADSHVSTEHGFALGVETVRTTHYLSIAISPAVDADVQRYRLTASEYRRFAEDDDAGAAFADECRAHGHDDRLIRRPSRPLHPQEE